MSKWKSVPLSALVAHDRAISYGIVQPGSHQDGGVPILRVADIRGGRINASEPMRVSAEIEAAHARTRLRGGELLLTLVGTVGEAAVVPQDLAGWNVARAVAVIPIREDVGTYWVKLALETPSVREMIHGRLNTTVQATLNLKDVAQLPILLPSLDERLNIANILGTLDDKIELNRRTNATLEAMARAIFKSWFVDFEPVRAKASGEPPESICRRLGLTSELLALFPDSFQESELAEIPKGWEVGRLGDVANHPRRGVQPNEIPGTTPYIALEHMPRHSIALADWDIADGLESNKFEFKRGEVLFGKLRPYFHKVGVAPVSGVCSTDIVVIKPRSDDWFGYVLGHVSSDVFVDYTNAGSTGTKMPRTSWKEMATYAVAKPPEAVAAVFTRQISALVDRIIASIHESRELMQLRNSLLPRLLSGELDAISAKCEMEEAAAC